jgi:hypothetical protein
MNRACGTNETRYVYNILIGKPYRKTGIVCGSGEDDIDMYHREIGCDVNWQRIENSSGLL